MDWTQFIDFLDRATQSLVALGDHYLWVQAYTNTIGNATVVAFIWALGHGVARIIRALPAYENLENARNEARQAKYRISVLEAELTKLKEV